MCPGWGVYTAREVVDVEGLVGCCHLFGVQEMGWSWSEVKSARIKRRGIEKVTEGMWGGNVARTESQKDGCTD